MRPARSGVQRGIRRATHTIPRRIRHAAGNRKRHRRHPCWLATLAAVVPQCAARGARRALLAVAAGLGRRVRPVRPHECLGALIGRVKSGVCVRASVRAYARWELKEGHGGQILAAVAIPAHERAADSLPPARLRASVAHLSPTAARDRPSLQLTASQAALWPVGPHLRLPAPQARAQAALSSDGHKPLTTRRMGVQVLILPRTLRLQCGGLRYCTYLCRSRQPRQAFRRPRLSAQCGTGQRRQRMALHRISAVEGPRPRAGRCL